MIHAANNLKTDVMHEYSGEQYKASFSIVTEQESTSKSYFCLEII